MPDRAGAPPRAWQRMLSGRRLDLLDPSPLDVEIVDIAHGLARVARWNGQTRGDHAFSVAQHSLLVEEIRDNQKLVSGISSGSDTPVYADGSFEVDMRLDPEKIAPATEAVLKELAKVASEAARTHTGCHAELATTGGTSDGRFIIDVCPEVLEIGPVNASIHKLNEHVTLEELEILPRIYLDVLRKLLP